MSTKGMFQATLHIFASLALGSIACAQSRSVNINYINPNTGNLEFVNGTITETLTKDQELALSHERTMEFFARMRERRERRNLINEMEEQTRLLREIADKSEPTAPISSPSSPNYLPASIPPLPYVTPSSYASPKSNGDHAISISRANEEFFENQVLRFAQRARSFNAASKQPRDRQLSSSEFPSGVGLDNPTNDDFIEGLLQGYEGSFTDYKWTTKKVDTQTYLVSCNVSLDGETHDFQFKVNSAVGSCRYEGGTALAKLAPPQPKSKRTPLENNKAAPPNESSNWWDKYR